MKTQKLIYSLFLLFINLSPFISATENSLFELNEVYPISETGTVYLDSEDADVFVTATDRTDVQVEVLFKSKKGGFTAGKGWMLEDFEVTERDGDLYLNDIMHNGSTLVFFGWTSTEYRIEIEIPKNVSVELRGEDDDYELSGIGGKIELDSEDGDVLIRDCSNSMDLDVEDGDVDIKRCSGKARIEMMDGELSITRGRFDALRVRTQDGDMEIETSLSKKGSYRIATQDGDVSFEITKGGADILIEKQDGDVSACREFEKIENRKRGEAIYQLNGGGAQVEMITQDGDIALKAD